MVKTQEESTKSLVLTGMFVAVLAVLSQLSLPMPSGVPITLQTFAVALTAYVLGPKLGAAAVIVYILLGAVGVPVYAGFGAGTGALFGMSGGFFWGFILMAVFCGIGFCQNNKMLLIGWSALALIACHLSGVLQFMLVMNMSFVSSVLVASLPYLLKDALSVVAAYFAAAAVHRALSAASF